MTDFRPALADAARDYRLLLDRGYPEKASGGLVGNRHRLDADERLMLFRGVASKVDSARRRGRLGEPRGGELVLLDAYNVAFTLVHYFLGKPCFLCSDGFLRDAGANYGRVSRDDLLGRAFGELAEFLRFRGLTLEAFLDAPVSRSGDHAATLRGVLAAADVSAEVRLERSADGAIVARVDALSRPVLVAGSDSILVDRSPAAWDLARDLLETKYRADFPDFAVALDDASDDAHDVARPGSPFGAT